MSSTIVEVVKIEEVKPHPNAEGVRRVTSIHGKKGRFEIRRRPSVGNEVTRAWRVPWWRRCQCCGDEFRFEHAWTGCWTVGLAMPSTRTTWHRGFVCLRCAPLPEKAMRFFGVIRPSLPSGPPPPPPPISAIGHPVPAILVR